MHKKTKIFIFLMSALCAMAVNPASRAADIDALAGQAKFSVEGQSSSIQSREGYGGAKKTTKQSTSVASAVSGLAAVATQGINQIEFFDQNAYDSETAQYDKTRPDIANNTRGAIAGKACRNLNGEVGNLRSIPLPIGEVEGTGSFATDDAGNFGCVVSDTPEGESATITTATGEEVTVEVPREIVITQKDLQQMDLPAAVLHHDNAPNTLKNYHTNIYAEAGEHTFTKEITGERVQVRATPVSYTFDYGDGTSLGPTSNPGYSTVEWDVQTPTSHQYQQTGTFFFSVTTEYRGEFRVGSGPWRVIDGTATVTTEPQRLEVWRVSSGRVADDCEENSESWGCIPESK